MSLFLKISCKYVNLHPFFKANYVDVINDNKGKGGKVTDEQKEGTFVNLNNNKVSTNLAWKTGEPNGGNTQNSVRIDLETRSLEDTEESPGDCFACKLERSFTARYFQSSSGLCM